MTLRDLIAKGNSDLEVVDLTSKEIKTLLAATALSGQNKPVTARACARLTGNKSWSQTHRRIERLGCKGFIALAPWDTQGATRSALTISRWLTVEEIRQAGEWG